MLATFHRQPENVREDLEDVGLRDLAHGIDSFTLAGAQALLGAIVALVESIDLAGPYEPWMTTVGHGPIRQPVKLEFA